MIYDQIRKPEKHKTPHGSIYLNEYQEQLNENGQRELIKCGEKNIYAMIQQDADSVDIQNILHSVAMGDLQALKQREATYCDATTMPSNLMEAQNIILKARDEFYKMPLEVRKEFKNDPEVYVSEMGTKEFIEKLAPYNEKILAISKEKNDKEYRKKVKEGAQLNIDIEREMESMKGGSAE